jgi:trans-2,3-dihydro-3-hydroxyanthranilate isomerase
VNRDDIVTDTHEPPVCSVGLPFVFTELRNRAALERARINMSGFERLRDLGLDPQMYLYTRVSESGPNEHGFDIRARMFAPLSGVPEDPATGSANCTLGGLLAHHEQVTSGMFSWRIAQGVEMGRPSTLVARAEKKEGEVTKTWIGGAAVMVSEGTIEVD